MERDAESARAVAALALEAIPHDVETIVGKATTFDGAKRIIDRLAAESSAPLIVICAADLDEQGDALRILDFARRQHPMTRAVVLTDGESRQLRHALELQVDGLHARDSGLDGLRRILAYLGSARHDPAPAADAGPRWESFRSAESALASALDAMDEAQELLATTSSTQREDAARSLLEAQRHAVLAHRLALDAERLLGARGAKKDADRASRNS